MAVSDVATTLPGLIDELLTADASGSVAHLFSQNVELRQRDTLLQIADAINQIAREDLSKAERLSAAGAQLADLLQDDYCRARIGRASGNIQVLRGKYNEALEVFKRALDLFRELEDELEEAATLSASLQPLIYQGRYSEAFERAQRAHSIALSHKNELMLGRLEINLGNIFHRQDRFTEAVEHYKRALVALEKLQQYRDCAVAWGNLAVCYISLNDFRAAESAYEMARTISQQQNMPVISAQADYNIAYLHYNRGEHNVAIRLYQQTRLYCESVGDKYHAALCDLDQAEMYLELHLNREGAELAQQALVSFEQASMGYEAAKARVFLGVAAYQDRKNFRALEFFADAQQRMKKEQNDAWVAIIYFYQALIFKQEGRLYEALRDCKAAQSFYADFPDSGKAVLIQCFRADLHLDLGELEEADRWARQAAISAEILESATLQTHAYWILGRVNEARTTASESYVLYQTALSFLEAVPSRLRAEELKIPFGKNRLELYEALVSLAPLSGEEAADPEAVFELIEKAKSRDLAEQISFRSNAVPASAKGRSALAEQVKSLREELNWYYRQINTDLQSADKSAGQSLELRRSIRSRESALVRTLDDLHVTDEEFHAIQTASIIPLQRIRAALEPDEVIVEYYQARGFIYACVLRRGSMHIAALTTVERVRNFLLTLEEQWSKCRLGDKYIRKFYAVLSDATNRALAELYADLVAPVAKFLAADRLIIIPDGLLNYLPFHAFFDGSQYLGEKHVISYAGSASLYCLSLGKESTVYDHDLILTSNSQAAENLGDLAGRLGYPHWPMYVFRGILRTSQKRSKWRAPGAASFISTPRCGVARIIPCCPIFS